MSENVENTVKNTTPEPKVTFSNYLFYLTKGTKLKNIQFAMLKKIEFQVYISQWLEK